ncbi:hypothetical protein MMC20_006469 [Loxospora ochrophaea]|nr:hypothetical protein [Loxospora ochrophaea]
MGGYSHSSDSTQLTVSKALDIVRNGEPGDAHPAVTNILERAISDIWRRINAQPTSYVMTKDEFAVFNYFRGRYAGSPVAQRAVGRFWDHFHGDGTGMDGAGSS